MTENISTLSETALIAFLAKDFLRSPQQRNNLFESDAELIGLPGTDLTLAVTTDSLCEEIESGLYSDPYQIGWMTVMANASDLAAVGAHPVGLLINETLPMNTTNEFIKALQQGIADASRAIKIPILGGDTNFGKELHMSATAIGTAFGDRLLTRIGCKPGDLLFTSGILGQGNYFAASAFGFIGEKIPFAPIARIAEGEIIRQYATCCMDTSDGFLNTLGELKRLNKCGFDVTSPIESYLSPLALGLDPLVLKPWMVLAGPHGEFELVFTIPESNSPKFSAAADEIGWVPLLLGKVGEKQEILLQIDDNSMTIETSKISIFVYDSRESISEFIRSLWRIDEESRIHHLKKILC